MPARTAGRSGRPTRRLFAHILDASRICMWCGHDGANAVGHTLPLSRYPDHALDPDNLRPVHGREGCPVCPRNPRTRKQRNCNAEIGDRIPFVEVFPPAATSRPW